MKRIAFIMAIWIAISALTLPFACAETYVTARTPLNGSSEGKRTNIDLAIDEINSATVYYGETFSFNDVVGPRTEARGYVTAINGRGAQVTGGGVGQVASTLYLALCELEADRVVFDEINTYGARFTEIYVTDNSAALMIDYNSGADFRFTNYAADEMSFSMYMSDDYLYCSIQLADSVGESESDEWDFEPVDSYTTSVKVASASLLYDGDEALLSNIQLAADSIYDSTLSTYDVWSFNEVVGPRTERYGYVVALNGRGADVVGGGVGQVASVVWMAVKNLGDISVIEKSTYGSKYNQSYVLSSADAILVDYDAETDFAFRYTGEGSITIYTYTNGDSLFCDVYQNR